MYNFGLYHWRRRLRALLLAFVVGLVGVSLRRRSDRVPSALGSAIALGAAIRCLSVLRTLLTPLPWRLRREKYDALASALPLEGAERAVDVGCGTGRSLVGLAPWLPPDCEVIGLDVFDDRVILGNGPALARRNGAIAGLSVEPVCGDAARLPLASDTADAVTACRVLHDLPATEHDRALEEIARVCAPDGTVGVLELPIVPDDVDAAPARYWRERVADAGLEIESLERIDRPDGGYPYVVIVASPA